MLRRPLLLALTTGLVAGGLVGCGADGRDPGWSGEAGLPSATRSFTLQVPSGRLEVAVSAPTETVGTSETTVDGGAYVVVSWREVAVVDATTRLAAGVADYATLEDTAEWEPELQVDLGDTGVDVPADVGTAIAVADDVDPTIVVTVDGETQSLDLDTGEVDAGAFAPYYAEPGQTSGGSGSDDVAPDESRFAGPCPVEVPDRWRLEDVERLVCDPGVVATVPYVGGAGWAPPGSVWLTATLSFSGDVVFFGPRAEPGVGDEALQMVTGVEATLDGEPVETVLPLYPGLPLFQGTRLDTRLATPVVVADVPADPEIGLRVRFRSSAGPFVVAASFSATGAAS